MSDATTAPDAVCAVCQDGPGRHRVASAEPVDLQRNARILEQVLDLAEQLPTRRRGRLRFPAFPRHAG